MLAMRFVNDCALSLAALVMDKKKPDHLCNFVCCKTCNSNFDGVVHVEGGCAGVAEILVLDAF